ncbi:hypothetical protein TPHA_0B02580 [Tetrapisispora phaffii CBS 4417]|uniref:Homeobox domain-containing protein n=1 Tax=Tetrapisispora phaffii (strain ATCC 24235 / CBS 4417 / NBRC 1672 / NRRL Y-8282 / UCD 70-5) TaxID=1071381 RepID=G8BPK0_TETPH|nr:hypothetical protein TPHA_0B02580 [Tetrapisispora phaffii CBS 4417]CCE61931.1 hypothetical protein TPHA_0B02580 [Tetrapisispora phaffii CBS 4417]
MLHPSRQQQNVILPPIKSLIDSLDTQVNPQSYDINSINNARLSAVTPLNATYKTYVPEKAYLSIPYSNNIRSIPTPIPSPHASPLSYPISEDDNQILNAAVAINSINQSLNNVVTSTVPQTKVATKTSRTKAQKKVRSKSFSTINTQTTSKTSIGKRSNLPKQSVDVLNKWLLNHLGNPYPTPKEKEELLELTGLSKIQLSNWFINVRRRKIFNDYYNLINKHNGADSASSSSDEESSQNLTLPVTRRKKLSDRLEELKKLNEL